MRLIVSRGLLRFVQDSVTVCLICIEEEGDEMHIIIPCPVYQDLRL